MPLQRFATIDALRGAAIVWMTAYHFCFDLNHFGWIEQNFYTDPFWTWQRTAIVSLFLFCAGLGQAVASRRARLASLLEALGAGGGLRAAGHRRLLLDVSEELHLLRRAARHRGDAGDRAADRGLGPLAVAAGAVAILLKPIAAVGTPALAGPGPSQRAVWNWLGLVGRKPVTEDYVPVFPWLGVMWWGMAAGQWLLRAPPPLVAARGSARVVADWLGWAAGACPGTCCTSRCSSAHHAIGGR